MPKVEPKVKVIYLRCPNCGEEDEKVIYCTACDSPMDVVKVEMRGEDEVVIDSTITKGEAGEESEDELVIKSVGGASVAADDPNIGDIAEGGGFSLGDIFAEGDETGFTADSGGDEAPIDDVEDVLNRLDTE